MPDTTTAVNRQIVMAERPVGLPKLSDFKLQETPIPALKDGEVLIRAIYFSMDPGMRGMMRDIKTFVEPVQVGDVIRGLSLGQVVQSKNPDYKPGEFVSGFLGMQEYAVSNGMGLMKADPDQAPLTTHLTVLGLPGITACIGIVDICAPEAGHTVLVSAAAGAVGGLAGQIAKAKGARVVGIASTDEKCAYLVDELGFDEAINRKKTDDMIAAVAKTCPDGVNGYFDNTGGPILDAALANIAQNGRIAICGMISQYNNTGPGEGTKFTINLVRRRALMQGFVVFDHRERYGEIKKQLAEWLKAGKLTPKTQIVEGMDQTIPAFLSLFEGENTGKLLVKVNEPA